MDDRQLRPVSANTEQFQDSAGATYAEIIEVMSNLRILVRDKRRRLDNLGVAVAGELMDVNPSTVRRFEQGGGCYFDAGLKMLEWIAEPDHVTRARLALLDDTEPGARA